LYKHTSTITSEIDRIILMNAVWPFLGIQEKQLLILPPSTSRNVFRFNWQIQW
jgi:hypothetical protein